MKRFAIVLICFVAQIGYAQLLDSVSLSELTMYKSLQKANKVSPDSVYRLTVFLKKEKNLGEALSKFTNLQELRIKSVKLKEIPPQVFELKQLVILEVSNCQLIEIPNQIAKLSNLTHLILSRNYLVNLPPAFKYLKKLEYLDIWSNSIVVFPDEMAELKETLRIVDMRVIYMNDLRKEDLQKLLPNTKFYFSQSCDCH